MGWWKIQSFIRLKNCINWIFCRRYCCLFVATIFKKYGHSSIKSILSSWFRNILRSSPFSFTNRTNIINHNEIDNWNSIDFWIKRWSESCSNFDDTFEHWWKTSKQRMFRSTYWVIAMEMHLHSICLSNIEISYFVPWV